MLPLLAWLSATDPPPRPSELFEQAQSRLVQIEVTALGPIERTSTLEASDFRVKVNLKRITDVRVDRHCEVGEGATARPGDRPPVYLLYFDQPHLTAPGRQRAIDLARELIPLLVRDGARALVLSDADRLVAVHELSADAAALDTALKRLSGDRTQWDFFAVDEDERVARVVQALNDNGLQRGIALARAFQREEAWRAEKSLRRLALSLVRLAEIEGPKVALYFSDTVRANAGEHYLSFFSDSLRQSRPELRELGLNSVTSALPFDHVVNEAVARGIHFYPVLARGLVVPIDQQPPGGQAVARAGAVPSSSRTRFHDTQSTLHSLAAETGGQAFLAGDSGRRIAEQIHADQACTYLLSFDPTGLSEDAPLRMVVETTRPGVTLRSGGRVVIESESARLGARLLSAFVVDRPDEAAADLRASAVPTGYRRGAYTALLQVTLPPTPFPSSSWNVGASVITRDRVVEQVSGSYSVAEPNVRLVFEREVQLPAGPLELVAVAHEQHSGLILSQHVQLNWPDPDERPLSYGPIALLQPESGAFVRSGGARPSGSLCRTESEAAEVDRPMVLLGLVCRGRRTRGPLRVERRLSGAQELVLPDIDLDLDREDERCAQIRDLIPAGTLAPGSYRYRVRLVRDGVLAQETDRDFRTVSGEGG